jgi:hypothetical protein
MRQWERWHVITQEKFQEVIVSNVGKRVRSKEPGETERMRNGTIISDSDGICVIKWDNSDFTGMTLNSAVVSMIERYTNNSDTHDKVLPPKPTFAVILGGKS